MKTAIIHDWIMSMRGGERCLEVFCELFPQADLFTMVHKKGIASDTIENMSITTSFIQKLPFSMTKYRHFLPIFPNAIQSFKLEDYDLVLSSSHCVAKGIKKPKNAIHICYCYTPVRYAWFFFDEYFGKENFIKRKLISMTVKRLKEWDLKTNKDVDYFISISDNVRNRIARVYNRDSDVIYPPVDVEQFSASKTSEDFYLIVSALVPYKRIDLAIEAFNKTGKRLIIVGTGNSEKDLRKIAKPNIELLGYASDDKIKDLYARCRALIFPGEEDFGIVPVEAQACGKPVIAYGKGGALETIIPLNADKSTNYELITNNYPSGVFFYEQTTGALIEAIEVFEQNIQKFIPDEIRKNSLRFSRNMFKQNIKQFIDDKLEG